MKTFQLDVPHGFRLDAAVDFYAGFTPGCGMAAASVDRFTLTFRLDRTFEAVAVALREAGARLEVDVVGTDDEVAVRQQLGRMLGLEVDGHAWAELGQRDAVVGRLQADFPGFFTATKSSPYDAAAWSVISPRMPMSRAAAIKQSMARSIGDAVEIHGQVHHVFPAPDALRRVQRVEGLSDEKLARLHGVADAALEGRLDAHRLRAMDELDALRDLQQLRGIGPWSAGHVYYRGAAPIDALPTTEPRVLHGLAAACGLTAPTEATLRRVAHAWRPYRMWVCVLLSRHLARTGGWHAPGLDAERARAGRALTRRTTGGRC